VFLSLPYPDPPLVVRIEIRILPSSSKKSKKNLDFYYFLTFSSLKTDVTVPLKSTGNNQKNFGKNLFFIGIL